MSDLSVPPLAPGGADVTELLARMTLEEKASLLDGSDFWSTQGIDRLGVPAVMVTDGPHGLRKQAGEGDHLGLEHSVPATCFPPAAGLASTWNTDLLTAVGEALGRECRAEEVAVLLGPGVNMKRSPLCGRNFEYFSEDPLLAGALGTAVVQGIQSQGVGTSLKHFAANNQETHRMTVSAEVDERTLREIYFPAFEKVVREAQPWTVMCSYNRINGVYASEDPWLLTRVLREEWGFEGLVVSDWGAVNERAAGVAAGLDLEMPSSGGAGRRRIVEAVEAGRLAEADVDRAAARVLALVARSQPGLAAPLEVDVDAHHALARTAALESAVLLKNDDDVLPLDPTAGGTVAVVGEFARTPRYQGAGSSKVNPTRLDDALTALRTALAGSREVTFAPGFTLDDAAVDDALVAQAVEHARAAEVVLLFLGLPAALESEGYDREHIDLPEQQVALLTAVAEVNPNVVVVLANGGVVAVEPWQSRAKAVLEGWLLGQAGGTAVADLLLGVESPSGRLAETIPLRYADGPTVGTFPGEQGSVRYGEGLLIGYRWYDARDLAVAYPFGHGLSYTEFAYADLEVGVDGEGQDLRATVSCTVTNSGGRAGSEVVQVYVADPEASVFRPEQELKAFTKVSLAAGESTRVTLALDGRAFSWWSTAAGRWVVEGGAFEIRVGASSRDVRLSERVDVVGDAVATVLTGDAEISEWLEHPVVGGPLVEALRGAGGGIAALVLEGSDAAMLRAIPLSRFARFPGSPVSEQQVEEWVRLQQG
jgi:beta-glucosidase